MANLNSVLNDRIARVARKEIKTQISTTRRATVRYRREIAALKRQMQDVLRRLTVVQERVPEKVQEVPSDVPEGVRYSPRTVKALRAKLRLSGQDFGKLAGVSPLTVYSWEAGRSRPRKAQLARLVALRGIGKREALHRLGGEAGAGKRRRRGMYAQTAEAFITSLVQQKKATTTGDINAAWRKSGRPGKADNTLSRMVASRMLKRAKVKDGRGSSYRIAR